MCALDSKYVKKKHRISKVQPIWGSSIEIVGKIKAVIYLQVCVINTDTLPTEKFFILNICSNSTRQFEINKLCRVGGLWLFEK